MLRKTVAAKRCIPLDSPQDGLSVGMLGGKTVGKTIPSSLHACVLLRRPAETHFFHNGGLQNSHGQTVHTTRLAATRSTSWYAQREDTSECDPDRHGMHVIPSSPRRNTLFSRHWSAKHSRQNGAYHQTRRNAGYVLICLAARQSAKRSHRDDMHVFC